MKRVIRASVYTRPTNLYQEASLNPRKFEYYQYLENHISNVQEAWHSILRPQLEDVDPEVIQKVDVLVRDHDKSKYRDDEFCAYCDYFYPSEKFPKDEKAFDEAWLLHQRRNPHHYQYWILIRDSGTISPQDIPLEYILEMLCDWHSFSAVDPESSAYNWWTKNKSKMMLSPESRKLVEKYVKLLKDPLLN